jgi:hypothetical protein
MYRDLSFGSLINLAQKGAEKRWGPEALGNGLSIFLKQLTQSLEENSS